MDAEGRKDTAACRGRLRLTSYSKCHGGLGGSIILILVAVDEYADARRTSALLRPIKDYR